MAGKIRISKAKTDRQGIPDQEKSMVKASGKHRGSRSTTTGGSEKGEDGAERFCQPHACTCDVQFPGKG